MSLTPAVVFNVATATFETTNTDALTVKIDKDPGLTIADAPLRPCADWGDFVAGSIRTLQVQFILNFAKDGSVAPTDDWDMAGFNLSDVGSNGNDMNLVLSGPAAGGTTDNRLVVWNGNGAGGNFITKTSGVDINNVVEVDGSNAFTGVILGITPTLAAHLATKGYVDTAVAGVPQGDIKADGTVAFTANVTVTTSPPVNTSHLTRKDYVDQVVGAVPVGDVVGPASAVDGNVASYDTTTGELIQDSGVASGEVVTQAAATVDATLAAWSGTGGQTLQPTDIAFADVVEVDGTNPFTGTIAGITPAADADLTTRLYVTDRQPYGVFNIGSDASFAIAGHLAFTSNAVTVTSATGGQSGQLLAIKSTVNGKMVQHATGTDTFELRNNRDMVLNNGDFIFFQRDGNRWIEIARKVILQVPNFSDAVATFDVTDLEAFLISGSTTITNFTDAFSSQSIRILAVSARTVQDNTNIKLLGGVDYDMVTDDTLSLSFLSGKWREMARSSNA